MPDDDKPAELTYQDAVRQLNDYGALLVRVIGSLLRSSEIAFHAIDFRVKQEESANRKILSKPGRYSGYDSLTDMLGVRVITYFPDEVDQVAEILRREFVLDLENCVDKRKQRKPEEFGYMSLHYILKMHPSRAALAEYVTYRDISFEIQVRSILQHAWAEIEHDLGYKSGIDLPYEISRRFFRLAGLLEVADEEFRSLRDVISSHKKDVQKQISISLSGIDVDQTTVPEYFRQNPFAAGLDKRLAALLGYEELAELTPTGVEQMVRALRYIGIREIAELDRVLRKEGGNIAKFTESWIGVANRRPASVGSVGRGVSAFYLIHLLAARDDEDTREKILRVVFPGADDSKIKSISTRIAAIVNEPGGGLKN